MARNPSRGETEKRSRGRWVFARSQERVLRNLIWLSVIFIASETVSLGQDPAAALENVLIKIVERAEPSVVSIARFRPSPLTVIEDIHRAFPRPRRREMDRSAIDADVLPNEFGAGFLISPPNSLDRLILTNHHVVRGGPVFPNYRTDDDTELRIQFSDHRACLASIIAADPRSDLAVLRLDWEHAGIKPTDFPCLNWETATPPRKGQFVILLGNPHAIARDGSASVSWGLVSNLTRHPITFSRNQPWDQDEAINKSMLYRLGAVMQLDARLNLGTSGGPVLNLKGELIGISTSLAAIEGYEQSVGFALPIDPLTRRIVRNLLAGQEVEYGMIGIRPEEISPDEFLRLNTGLPQRSAAKVGAVQRGSPADLERIVSGDVIVNVEGEPVRSVADLMRMVGLHPPDQEIEITVLRSLKRYDVARLETVRIKLGKWPVQDDEGIIETNPRYSPWRGLSVDYPTARGRLLDLSRFGEMSPSSDFRRVLVTKVIENSPAHDARLEPGNFITHVNNTPVKNPAEFHAAVKLASGPVSLTLSEDSPDPLARPRGGRIVLVRE